MFKLVVLLCALAAVANARPSLPLSPALVYSAPAAATVTVHEPALAHVGSVVKTYPTAVSHQSHSVVHNSAHLVQDVVAPVVKTTYTTAPVLKSVSTYAHTPVVYNSW